MNDEDKVNETQQEAMGRKIPADPDVKADDQTTLAMKENRKGAHANPSDGDQQASAMSNEFILKEGKESEDEMTKAMSENRKQADSD